MFSGGARVCVDRFTPAHRAIPLELLNASGIALAGHRANVATTTSGCALPATLAPASLVTTVEAMVNISGSIGGSVAPLITGHVVRATGTLAPALFIAAAIAGSFGIANQWLATINIRA